MNSRRDADLQLVLFICVCGRDLTTEEARSRLSPNHYITLKKSLHVLQDFMIIELLQLDWPAIELWAYASTFAVGTMYVVFACTDHMEYERKTKF